MVDLGVIFMDDIPRCLLIFENSCKSVKTYKDYKDFLDVFLTWAHKDYESLLMMGQVEIEELLQDYCIYQKRRADSSFPFRGMNFEESKLIYCC